MKSQMNCPNCDSHKSVKAGRIRNKQRYKCTNCIYYYTLASEDKNKRKKRQALELYLEGLGYRSIGRILNVSHVSIYRWIKLFGSKLKELQSETDVCRITEIDEMHSYIGSKKTQFGSGLLLIDMIRGSSTLLLETDHLEQVKNYGIRSVIQQKDL